MLSKRIWLCVPPLLVYIVDFSLTMAHQTEGYWNGCHEEVLEANPVARAVMLYGPAAAIIGAVAYGLSFTVILLFWRNSLTLVLAYLLTLGHAVGAGSWLAVWHGAIGWITAIGLLVMAERLLALSWAWSGLAEKQSKPPQPGMDDAAR